MIGHGKTEDSPAAGALEMMIAPLSKREFFEHHYERKFFHSTAKNPAVADLVSLDRIDEVISDSELPPTALTMAQSGQSLAPSEYTYENGNIDRGAVLDNFRNGATLVMPQLQWADGKLYNFCLALEREFGARVQTNIYLTPPGEHGFGIHYDDHDVFVIQIAGAKEWEIYGDRDGLPYKGEGFRKERDDPGELREKFVLQAGECAYVPRGTAHRAPTHGDEPSLHITVGILVQTWAEFMLEAVAEASLRIPELRHSLPRSLFVEAHEEGADNAATFARLIHEIADTASFDATKAAFAGNFIRAQGPRVRGALIALAEGIGPDDRLSVRDNILYSFENVPAEDDKGAAEEAIVLTGSSVPMSSGLAGQLRDKLTKGSMAKSEFKTEDAEELDDVIGTLVAYGLLMREDGV